MIEIASGLQPATLEGEQLDPGNLHDWLSLPIQHFFDKHPDKPRDAIIQEACEVVAELVNACGHDWKTVRPWGQFAMDSLNQSIRQKFEAHDRIRRQRN